MSRIAHAWSLLSLAACVIAGHAGAGEFVINPLRVELDRTTRSSEVIVRNDDKAPLRMQVQAMSWTQNADGTDNYEATDGLLYFPRTMEIPPGESRIVRVGVRAAPVSREDTYRLFIEELPPAAPETSEPQGTSLRVFLRVGVAVFVAPAQAERKVEITRLERNGLLLDWAITNAGNVHVRADAVELIGLARDGSRLFSQQYPERYFLAGTTRPLRFEIPRAACGSLATVEASLVADRLALKRKLDVESGFCK
jgi:fimbrial chaperone protein